MPSLASFALTVALYRRWRQYGALEAVDKDRAARLAAVVVRVDVLYRPLVQLGPPGSGKTMLARAFASLLPDLGHEEALEVAAVYSLRGALRERPATSTRPPFRAPHHSVSRAGLVGGGSGLAQPGELSLAHPSMGECHLNEGCGAMLPEAMRTCVRTVDPSNRAATCL